MGWRTPSRLWRRLKPEARRFRSGPTGAEAALWNALRRKRMLGFKFRRQHTLGRFIVDFYCHEANLVIEVDGSVHTGRVEEDAARQAYLEHLGLRVIRFGNEDITASKDKVLATIATVLRGA